jgi:hypothetical protein
MYYAFAILMYTCSKEERCNLPSLRFTSVAYSSSSSSSSSSSWTKDFEHEFLLVFVYCAQIVLQTNACKDLVWTKFLIQKCEPISLFSVIVNFRERTWPHGRSMGGFSAVL